MHNKRLFFVLMLSLTMLLLMSGTSDSANITIGQFGTTLTEPAYIVPLKDGRDTLALIESQSAEIETLWDAISKKDIQIDKLVDLAETTNSKRLIAEEKLQREKKKRWGLGVFGGVGHRGEAVIGVGVTYNLIKF